MATPKTKRSELRAHLSWANPALLAGRSDLEVGFFYLLIVAGAATDTVAFKSVLDLVLQESEIISWLLAVGITFVALAFAWTIGRLYSNYRHEPEASGWPILPCLIGWTGLGCAMAYIRSHATPGAMASSNGFGAAPDHSLRYGTAFLFAMLYFASGMVAIFEAFHLINPVYAAYRRVGRQVETARKTVAHLTGQAERARLVAVHHSGEFDRDLQRRDEALGAYKALGAELKNYSRVLMATIKQDPRITDLTSRGPKALDDPYPYADGSVPIVEEPDHAPDVVTDDDPASDGDAEGAKVRPSDEDERIETRESA